MKITVDGKAVDVRVTAHLQWDPPLEAIIETVPIAEVLKLECIVLNAARMALSASTSTNSRQPCRNHRSKQTFAAHRLRVTPMASG